MDKLVREIFTNQEIQHLEVYSLSMVLLVPMIHPTKRQWSNPIQTNLTNQTHPKYSQPVTFFRQLRQNAKISIDINKTTEKLILEMGLEIFWEYTAQLNSN